MFAEKILSGMNVLVTRPEPQGGLLCNQIRDHGGQAIFFPTISILPPADSNTFQNRVAQLNQFDWLIFISPQAVYQSAQELQARWPVWPDNLKIAAIGAGTAQALQDAKFFVAGLPEDKWNSEGLLELPEFQQVKGKKIAILKGEGGREFLAATLIERGAVVVPIDAYQRSLPDVDIDLIRNTTLDVIVCTSNEGLKNLVTLLSPAPIKLQDIPLLVISQRMKDVADELGFKKILLAKNASNYAIFAALAHEKGANMNTDVKENASQTSSPATQRKNFPWRGAGILFSTLGVLILLFVFYGTDAYFLKNFSQQASQLIDVSDIQKNINDLQQQVLQLNETTKSQEEIITSLRQTQSGYNRDEWHVLEAEFLAKLANDKLQLENNVGQAILLLQAADQEVLRLNDGRLLSVRKALADDIASLQAVPQVDVTGVYMQLSAASDQVNKLPLPNKPTATPEASTTHDEVLPWWKRGLQQTWQALKQIVIVRYNQNGALPLVTPEQQDFFYQNLHATLEKAMWALLHQQPEIYKASLQQTIDWIKQYCLLDSPVTQSMLTNLTQLQAINVHPEAPKTLAALQAFHDFLASRNVSAVAQPATSNQ